MSEDKSREAKFLARWSRRKQEASTSGKASGTAMHDAEQSASQPVVKGKEEFDLSSLPSIDSITSATDIKAFLRKGIPQELTRAALRRAWSADPAIRDFVGLAENAWDFNDPSAMPGFGALDCSEEELATLVDRIVGGMRKALQSLPEVSVVPMDSSPELHQAGSSAVADAADRSAATESAPAPVAVQPAAAEGTQGETVPVRRRTTHGGALPS